MGVIHDLRYALRQLRRSPTFTLAAVVTLALGMGATTAVFTLVQQVMLRRLPVARPEQLWRIGDSVTCCYRTGYAQNDWTFFSWDAYRHFRANTPALEQLAALQVGQLELGVRRAGSRGETQARVGEYVSGNFFATLGVSAWRGRLFTDADDRKGAPPVAVMSFHAWQNDYGADPSVIGATFDFNGHPFTVVGVAPPGFFGAKSATSGMPDIWLPLTTEPMIAGATTRLENPRIAWLDLIGRVRPETNRSALEATLRVQLTRWLAEHTGDMAPREAAQLGKQTLHVTPGGAGVSLLRESYEKGLRLLFLIAACLLAIACANIANLMLARGLRHRPELALRAAIGASRSRLVRKALAESLALSALGGIAGVAVAYGGAKLILGLAFTNSSSWVAVEATPSMPVLLFALALSVATGIVFGIAPALTASRADPIDALRASSRGVGQHRGRTQRALVVVQTAVSIVLLSAAAMLGRSLGNLEHHDVGFSTNGRYMVWINSMLANYQQERLLPLAGEIEDRLRTIPGVRMASSVLYAPLSGYSWSHAIRVEGGTEPAADMNSGWTRVTPRFFETVGDRIVLGRGITDSDNAATRRVAVVNQAFAKRFFGGRNPIGRHFGPGPLKNAGTYEIVGVASDIRFQPDFSNAVGPMYFVPEAQSTHFEEPELESREVWSHNLYNVVLWAPGNPTGLEEQVRAALTAVDPGLVIYKVDSYAAAIRDRFTQEHMIASLTWLFGAVGLLLAAVGLYGVTAYGVEQRTNEIGIRMALGADRRSLAAGVIRRAFQPALIGIAIGIPLAMYAGRLMASQLYGVSATDPLLLGGAVLLLAAAAVAAAVIPARRAAAVSPMEALRAE